MHGGRDGLGGEGGELIGQMGIGLESRFVAVFCIDQVHCFALARGCEELAITGSGEPQSPVLGHRQPGLLLDHRGQGTVHCVAFDMPARQAREFPVLMGVGGFSHLVQAVLAAVEKRVILASCRGFVRSGVGLGTGRLSSFPTATVVGL